MKKNPNSPAIILILPLFLVGIFILSGGCDGPAGPDGDDAVIADSVAPAVEWIDPPINMVIDTAITFQARATDDQGIWKMVFYIGGFEFPGSLTDSITSIYSVHWNARLYPEGPYPLIAKAWDTDRNAGSTPLFMVYIEHGD